MSVNIDVHRIVILLLLQFYYAIDVTVSDRPENTTYNEDVPQNVVVLAGMEVTLECSRNEAFRWYVYQLEKPTDAQVIYLGSELSPDVDQNHFQVFKEPGKRLNLRIKDVQASDAGTYECLESESSACAEIIVLDSTPRCQVKLLEDDNEMVALQCDIMVTENGEPHMNCVHESGSSTEATCSTGSNGMVSCVSTVSAMSHANYTCSIKINSKPKLNKRRCIKAANIPQYSYKWTSSEVTRQTYIQGNGQSEMRGKIFIDWTLLVILAGSILLHIITFLTFLVVRTVRRSKDGICQKHDSKFPPGAPLPPEYASLAFPAPEYCSLAAQAPEYTSITPKYISLICHPASTYEEIVVRDGRTDDPIRIVSPHATHLL